MGRRLDDSEFKLLNDAANDIESIHRTAERYVNLRAMLAETSPTKENEFKKEFSRYYGLNAAGLKDEWKTVYFELLFSFRMGLPDDPHKVALRKLYPIERRQGGKTLQFSFVSKLVSIHDESQPLFDRYVNHYFGLGPPSLMRALPDPEFRILGFLRNLAEIRGRYAAWSDDDRFVAILRDLRKKIPRLLDCHTVRICDFLVWAVGKKYNRKKAP
jgi:hypothetical protein